MGRTVCNLAVSGRFIGLGRFTPFMVLDSARPAARNLAPATCRTDVIHANEPENQQAYRRSAMGNKRFVEVILLLAAVGLLRSVGWGMAVTVTCLHTCTA